MALGHPPMLLLMDADGDADMLLLMDDDGVGFMFMFMEAPPSPMLWWTDTHQFHTSACTGPATTPMTWPSFWVQTMYSSPWLKLQNTRPAALSSVNQDMVI